ncbi:MAG: polyprenyl synthetase family protein [Bradyrhizobiaceae bacterium]|nr:polyprenyl synthetase family protein [Bradyrhizobiaceae bacterium]
MKPVAAPSQTLLRRLDAVAAATETALMAELGGALRPGEIGRPARLLAAMRHGATGGKRIRPFLLIESAALFGVAEATALPAAAAFECVHCYSLIHDDLPAMDDDDLRRGRPTTHIAFDEATAILAGDSLLTLAFDLLANLQADSETRVALIALLARASGVGGMAGGQMLDLEAEGRFAADRRPLALSLAEIEKLQAMKTGALLAAVCEGGAMLGRAREQERSALADYARALGLAFQIADDLLDAEGDAASLGKTTAKDASRGKATLVSALGVDGARKRLAELIGTAEAALTPFGPRADMLRECARYVAAREK